MHSVAGLGLGGKETIVPESDRMDLTRFIRHACLLIVLACPHVLEAAPGPSNAQADRHRSVVFNPVGGDGYYQRFGNEHKAGVPSWAEDCNQPTFIKGTQDWARRCSPVAVRPAAGLQRGGKPSCAGSLESPTGLVKEALKIVESLSPARCN